MSGVVAVENGHIRQFHYIGIQNPHLAQSTDSRAWRIGWVLSLKTRIGRIDMFGCNVDCLTKHRSSRFKEVHSASLRGFAKQIGNSHRNVSRNVWWARNDENRRSAKIPASLIKIDRLFNVEVRLSFIKA